MAPKLGRQHPLGPLKHQGVGGAQLLVGNPQVYLELPQRGLGRLQLILGLRLFDAGHTLSPAMPKPSRRRRVPGPRYGL
jgi:hypothetical protein